MAKTSLKIVAREKRISRIRKKIAGTSERPRLRVFKSNKHIYAQIINDSTGSTLVAMSTIDKDYSPGEDDKSKSAAARRVGLLLAERARSAGIEKVVFDRGGYIYHGRVKSLSEGAREGGLIF
ncbi:MAG: 50S ribosomal protein L18 [Desulfobulbaceae bacterium]|nr:MAG: 50S ribosomal protein L18 [Desulfobulbaceae bacterium]